MRILWHSVGPWHKTGFGVQTALFAPRLAGLGHEVVLSWVGRKGIDDVPARAHPESREALATGRWRGLTVIGPGETEFALPRPAEIRAAFGGRNPDLVLVFKDAWVLTPEDYRPWATAVWTAFDCEPMGVPDLDFFAKSGATPLAVSQWGLAQMRKDGLRPAGMIPHGIDLAQFRPPESKAAARTSAGLPPDHFIAGINATNLGQVMRKALPEQMAAFAQFHARHPKSLLLMHTYKRHPEGIDLEAVAIRLGIRDAVIFRGGDHARDWQNNSPGQMCSWYQALDVLLNATRGEGFGIPIIEAQACGVPVIATDCSAMAERIRPGTGWLVRGQQWWHPHFLAWWVTPSVPQLVTALEKAHKTRPDDELIWGTVAHLDADRVTREHWKPWLDAWPSQRAGQAAVLTSRDRKELPNPGGGLAVLVPSRGRPQNVTRLVRAVKDTAHGHAFLVFGFDEDDPQLEANLTAADGAEIQVRPRMGLAAWTNYLAAHWAGVDGVDALASLGDDHVPVTPGWDTALLKAIGCGGIAYPNDLIRDDIPEAVVISASIVRALGWMCLPSLRHWYVDNVWADLGKGAGCLAYLPDVIVKHERIGVPNDATYRDAWPLVREDEVTWRQWRAGQMDADIATVAAAIGAADANPA